jgi:flagellin-like protein
MLKSKKAISPILATLLLIVIAVAAIVVTYAWIMTYMSNAGQQAGVQLYKANIAFTTQGSTKQIVIDIGNSGTSNTEITKVFIGTTETNRLEQTTTPSLPAALVAGETVTVTINYNWNASTTYYFNILSSSGQSLPFPELSP